MQFWYSRCNVFFLVRFLNLNSTAPHLQAGFCRCSIKGIVVIQNFFPSAHIQCRRIFACLHFCNYPALLNGNQYVYHSTFAIWIQIQQDRLQLSVVVQAIRMLQNDKFQVNRFHNIHFFLQIIATLRSSPLPFSERRGRNSASSAWASLRCCSRYPAKMFSMKPRYACSL